MRSILAWLILSASALAQVTLGGTITGMQAGTSPTTLKILTTALPNGTVGSAYGPFPITTSGGSGSIACSVIAGTLPSGLAFTGCSIGGNPTIAGNSNFTVQATDQSTPVQVSQPQNLSVAILPVVTGGGGDNKNCNANETTTIAGTKDGPADNIQRCVRTDMASWAQNTPVTKTVCPAGGGCDYPTIQQAANAAACGWTIKVQAASGGVQTVYNEDVTLPGTACPANNPIILETDQINNSAFPPEGTRATPCLINKTSITGRPAYPCPSPGFLVPKVVNSSTGQFQVSSTTSHWRIIGFEFTTVAGSNFHRKIVDIAGAALNLSADHIVLDRVLCHAGNDPNGMTTISSSGCVQANGAYMAIIDSYLYDTHCLAPNVGCVDSQSISAGNGDNPQGPIKIVNNFLESAAQSGWLFGGGPATIVPHDLDLRRNHLWKPLFWKRCSPAAAGTSLCGNLSLDNPSYYGTATGVKNLGEFKNADRILMEGNIIENTWGQAVDQDGSAILVSPKNQSSSVTGQATSDGTGTLTATLKTFNSGAVDPNCATPSHCLVTYASQSYQAQTFIDSTHITVSPIPPAGGPFPFVQCSPGLNPTATVTNLVIRYNYFHGMSKALQDFSGLSDCGDKSLGTHAQSIHDNVADDLDGFFWNLSNGGCCAWSVGMKLSNGQLTGTETHDVLIAHNTLLPLLNSHGGTPSVPAVCLSPTSLTYGGQIIGTTSASQPITVSSCGTQSVIISAFSTTGDFAQTNNCGTLPVTLTQGSSCTMNVTFTPTAAGARAGTAVVTSNDASSPDTANLAGTGQALQGQVVLTPTSLVFPATAVGTDSATKSITVSNSGGGTATLNTITIVTGTNFIITSNGCGATLASGANCTVVIKFHPLTSGGLADTFSVTDNTPGSPHTAGLSGTGGTGGGGGVTVYPKVDSIPFGAALPMLCDPMPCTLALTSGPGTLDASGNYFAPASGSTTTVQITASNTAGTSTDTATITVTGSMQVTPQTYPNTSNRVTFTHTEQVGTMIRNYYIIKPPNLQAGVTGLILDLGTGGHPFDTSKCAYNNPGGNESFGWPFYSSTTAQSYVFGCLDGATQFTTSGHPIFWHRWGQGSANWCHGPNPCPAGDGTVPDDNDFVRQVILRTVADLNLDPRKVYIVNDWNSSIPIQAALMNSDLVAAVSAWNDNFMDNTVYAGAQGDTTNIQVSSSAGANFDLGFVYPTPKVPISYFMFASFFGSPTGGHQWSQCGATPNTAMTVDDQLAYFARINGATSFQCGSTGQGTGPGALSSCTVSGTKFCNGFDSSGFGVATNLETKLGTGKAGSAIAFYRILGNGSDTPVCGNQWDGTPLSCNGGSPVRDLRAPPALGTTSSPGNHFLDPANMPGSTTGDSTTNLVGKFFAAHPKPPIPTTSTATLDMIDWMTMDPNLAATSHMSGNSTPTYSVIEPANNRFWWIKNAQGFPWDEKTYDSNFIYDKVTEQIFNDPYTWKDHVPGGLGYPWAHRFITYDPTKPGLMIDEIKTATSNFDIHGDTTHAPGVCSAITSSSQLGHVKTQIWGPFTETLGGNLPANLTTFHLYWMWSCDTNWNNCAVREDSTLSQTYGQIRWVNSSLQGGQYVVQQDVIKNVLTSGTASPVHPCF